MKTNEHAEIAKFLQALTEKNYAEANKYLRVIVNTKLTSTIRKTQLEN